MSTHAKDAVAIVGGGFSGLSLARKAVNSGMRVAIFEKRHDHSGCWSQSMGLANIDSQLQCDNIVYKDAHKTDGFDRLYPHRRQVEAELARRARRLEEEGVEIRTGCEVQQVEDAGSEGVLIRYTQHGSEREATFASVHIRTGTLSKTRTVRPPGLSQFDGRWCDGVANGLERMPVEGSRVLVVGMGAFAVENAKRAVNLGAQRVTLLSRSANVVSPRALIYHGASSVFYLPNVLVPSERDARWDELFATLRQSPSTPEFDPQEAITTHAGCDHYIFSSSSQSDWFYAALAYGAVHVERGELVGISSPHAVDVRAANGEITPLEVDVIVFCVGQTCDTKLLEGVPLTSTLFGFDGKLTHNLRVDAFEQKTLFGPRCPIPIFPVLSYGLVCDLVDTLALAMVRDPTFYARWCKASTLRLYPELAYIGDVSGPDWLRLFWAMLTCGLPEVGGEIIGLMYDRYEAYYEAFGTHGEGGDWYDAVSEEWREQVVALQQWRHRVHGEPLQEAAAALPYPWPRPRPLQKQRRSRAFYQLVYYVVSWFDVLRVLALVDALPVLQWVLRVVMS